MDYLYESKNNKLLSLFEQEFAKEKDLQKLIENNVEELFSENVILIKSEFSIKDYRFDSLCYDEEENAFLIIEYKKKGHEGVIDQGTAYLLTMLENKEYVVHEYNYLSRKQKKDYITRDDVNWDSSKLIFVSPQFNKFQKESVIKSNERVELWEISQYRNNLYSINKFVSNTNMKKRELQSQTKLPDTLVADLEENLLKNRESTKELYLSLKHELLKFQGAELVAKKSYMTLQKNTKIVAYIGIRTTDISIQIIRRVNWKGSYKDKKINYTIEDPKELFQIIETSGGKKPGTVSKKESYMHYMKDMNNFNFLVEAIKHAYDNKY